MSTFKDMNVKTLNVGDGGINLPNYSLPSIMKFGHTQVQITAGVATRITINLGFTFPDTEYSIFYSIIHNSIVSTIMHKVLYRYTDRFEIYVNSTGSGNHRIDWLVVK